MDILDILLIWPPFDSEAATVTNDRICGVLRMYPLVAGRASIGPAIDGVATIRPAIEGRVGIHVC